MVVLNLSYRSEANSEPWIARRKSVGATSGGGTSSLLPCNGGFGAKKGTVFPDANSQSIGFAGTECIVERSLQGFVDFSFAPDSVYSLQTNYNSQVSVICVEK